ncbi:MAG: phosphoribosylformylglycinamidine synthase subunit PurQ [Fidelibacterota bacterium]|nr:MAG: phosphoribosylformylglycinamidine synthase subunit PurQ [Candidatus Neomarinimicrobiota bacterium]
MRFAVLVFPASNCDHDSYHVVRHVLGEEGAFVWHKETSLDGFDAVIIPGGFSYGDYLRTGAIARFSPIMSAVQEFAKAGKPVIGICNGFQILVEAGLLPGALISNRSLRFVSRMIYLRPEGNSSPFTADLDVNRVYQMPVAHQSGNYLVTDDELAALEDQDQIAFRYTNASGEIVPEANPNGSVGNIAGVLNKDKNVLGLMPHPERASEAILGSDDGLALFQSIIGNA